MEESHMKRVVVILLVLACMSGPGVLAGTAEVVNALRQEAVELQTPSDSQVQAVEMIELGCGNSQKWLGERGWSEGKNLKDDGEFYVWMDSATISAPPGHANYVVSRQNAYAKAFLKAKAKLVQYLQSDVSREITFNQKEGKFVIDAEKPAPAQGNPQEEGGLSAIKRKTVALINAYLDEKLQQKGIKPGSQPVAADNQALAKVAQEVRNSSQFTEIVKTSARSQLKGVRRVFVSESVKAGKQGEICVVALWSPKTMAMADAIFGDESLAPTGIPERPIREQVADWNKPEGVRKLISTFGTEMIRDERGQFHLIAYAQSAPQSESATSLNLATEKARLRAVGELRGFAQEYAVFNSAMQAREKAEELVNAMANYESAEALEQTLQSVSPPKSISGTSTLGTWAAKHPLTNQVIVGSIVRWSPSDSSDGRRLSGEMNSPAGAPGTSAGKGGNTFKPDAFKAKGSYEGSASGGSKAEDF
jgi:hypothetical protein